MSAFAAESGSYTDSCEVDSGSVQVQQQRCTYPLSSENLVNQAIYLCNTCFGDSGRCCCSGCAFTCHDGHDVQFMTFGRAYCDCGAVGCALSASSMDTAREVLAMNGVCGVTSIAHDSLGRVEGTEETNLQIDSFSVAVLENEALNDDGNCSTSSSTASSNSAIDILLRECQDLVTSSKETFWLGADRILTGQKPSCALEAAAASIFEYHTRPRDGHGKETAVSFDLMRSGAEWWVQVKDASSPAIDLHYDKDERIAESFAVGVFPQISTVTYLSAFESHHQPTVVLSTTASDEVGAPIQDCYISYPVRGKHIAFDGRFLHGAPDEPLITSLGSTANSLSLVSSSGQSQRVTFLVNIWLNHHPSGVHPVSDEIVASLHSASGECDNSKRSSSGIGSGGLVVKAVSGSATIAVVPVTRADIKESARLGEWTTLPFVRYEQNRIEQTAI